jgi:hypothetical protein
MARLLIQEDRECHLNSIPTGLTSNTTTYVWSLCYIAAHLEHSPHGNPVDVDMVSSIQLAFTGSSSVHATLGSWTTVV